MNISLQTHGADKAINFLLSAPAKAKKAAAGAINDTLKDIQADTGTEILPDVFTVRTGWWKPGMAMGFNIRPFANPNTLMGELGSKADWLKLHEEGGTKKSDDHRLAIPASDYKPKQAIMAKAIKPRTILSDWDKAKRNLDSAQSALTAHGSGRLTSATEKKRRHDLKRNLSEARKEFRAADKARKAREGLGAQTGSKAFIATMKGGFTGIFKRLTDARAPLKLLFSLTKYAKVEPTLAWEQAAKDLAEEKYDRKFAVRFSKEMK
jgi:hypothetical protein